VVVGVVLATAVHLWRETIVSTQVQELGAVIEIRPSGVVWFANAHAVSDAVAAAVARHPDVEVVRLRLDGFGRIDLTAALTLARLVEDLRVSGLVVEVSGLPAVARPVLQRVLDDGSLPLTVAPALQQDKMPPRS
jgi:MFS superfamily sulfate permease-like transporter